MALQSDIFPPIIVSEYAIQLMQKAFRLKLGFRPGLSKNELESLFREMQSSVKALKYSYLPIEEIAYLPEVKNLKEGALKLKEAIKPAKETKSSNQYTFSVIRWGIGIMQGMQRRIMNMTVDIGSGIDVIIVHVRNVQIQERLVHTRAYDSQRDYTIMTNLFTIKPNINLVAALLPPAEIGGYISEAMYLGLEERTEAAGTILLPHQINYKEVNAVLHQIISRR
ncbi:MAG: hypothetical protein EAX86_11310 [Candidatus Heimdallarchaeota archaeon]|nr:hypothetical protein [Candidatus Heimdallarchaeota archaeon]